MKPNKLGLLLLLVSGWAGFYSTVKADELPDFVKSRSYIGVFATSSDIDQWGGFNGENYLTYIPSSGVTETDFIPEITREFGWGALVGHREGPWAMEISYMRSNHTASVAGGAITEPATYQSIDITIKRYFFTKLPIQPFVNIGFSIPWLWVRQLSFLENSNIPSASVDDETISGIGLNLGAGLELYLDKEFSIMGGAFERWSSFDQVNGASKIPESIYFDGNTSDVGSLAGDGLNFYVGATLAVE